MSENFHRFAGSVSRSSNRFVCTDWYEWAVPLADDRYDEYLEELRKEGMI